MRSAKEHPAIPLQIPLTRGELEQQEIVRRSRGLPLQLGVIEFPELLAKRGVGDGSRRDGIDIFAEADTSGIRLQSEKFRPRGPMLGHNHVADIEVLAQRGAGDVDGLR